eukprot:5792970-Amphidinium_carterae.1
MDKDLHYLGCCGDHAAPDIFGNLAFQYQDVLVGLYYYEHRMAAHHGVDWGSISMFTGWHNVVDFGSLRLNWANFSDTILGREEYWSIEMKRNMMLQSRVIYNGEFFHHVNYPAATPNFVNSGTIVAVWNFFTPSRPIPPANVITWMPTEIIYLSENSYSDVADWRGTQTVGQRRELIMESVPSLFDMTIWGMFRLNRSLKREGKPCSPPSF